MFHNMSSFISLAFLRQMYKRHTCD